MLKVCKKVRGALIFYWARHNEGMKTLLLAILLSSTCLPHSWARTRILSDYQIRNQAENIAAKINSRGDWLVVSAEGAYFNGRKVLSDYQVSESGPVVAGLNSSGDWMVVSRKGGFVNGSEVVIGVNISQNSDIAADISDSGEWVIASSMGAYKGSAKK